MNAEKNSFGYVGFICWWDSKRVSKLSKDDFIKVLNQTKFSHVIDLSLDMQDILQMLDELVKSDNTLKIIKYSKAKGIYTFGASKLSNPEDSPANTTALVTFEVSKTGLSWDNVKNLNTAALQAYEIIQSRYADLQKLVSPASLEMVVQNQVTSCDGMLLDAERGLYFLPLTREAELSKLFLFADMILDLNFTKIPQVESDSLSYLIYDAFLKPIEAHCTTIEKEFLATPKNKLKRLKNLLTEIRMEANNLSRLPTSIVKSMPSHNKGIEAAKARIAELKEKIENAILGNND